MYKYFSFQNIIVQASGVSFEFYSSRRFFGFTVFTAVNLLMATYTHTHTQSVLYNTAGNDSLLLCVTAHLTMSTKKTLNTPLFN